MLIILEFLCLTGFFEGLVYVFPFIRNVISIFFEKLYPVESTPETYCCSKEGIKQKKRLSQNEFLLSF